jgi:hypothetical protein
MLSGVAFYLHLKSKEGVGSKNSHRSLTFPIPHPPPSTTSSLIYLDILLALTVTQGHSVI